MDLHLDRDEIPWDLPGDAWVVVPWPMSRWRMAARWLLRRPTADVYPVRINTPPDDDPAATTTTFTVPFSS